MGHAVRMYALAEELVRLGQSVVFATRTPEYICERLTLPCMVATVDGNLLPVGDVLVIDADEVRASANYDFAVYFSDFGPYMQECLVVAHPFCPKPFLMKGFIGPQWMPLRKEFSIAK